MWAMLKIAGRGQEGAVAAGAFTFPVVHRRTLAGECTIERTGTRCSGQAGGQAGGQAPCASALDGALAGQRPPVHH